MNRTTFKDLISSEKSSLANDIDDYEDDDEDGNRFNAASRRQNEEPIGEEESSTRFEDGEEMEPFNLKGDRELGHFEGDTFVFKKQVMEADSWLAGLDESSMEQAIGEAAYAVEVAKKREKVATSSPSVDKYSNKSILDIVVRLSSYMKAGESVSDLIRRASPPKSNSKKATTDISSSIDFDEVTELCQQCLMRGISEIYSYSLETLTQACLLWEYQPSQNGMSNSLNSSNYEGPFTSDQIISWMKSGYFKGSTSVWMRSIGNPMLFSRWKSDNWRKELAEDIALLAPLSNNLKRSHNASNEDEDSSLKENKRVRFSVPSAAASSSPRMSNSVDQFSSNNIDMEFENDFDDESDGCETANQVTSGPNVSDLINSDAAAKNSCGDAMVDPIDVIDPVDQWPRGEWQWSDEIEWGDESFSVLLFKLLKEEQENELAELERKQRQERESQNKRGKLSRQSRMKSKGKSYEGNSEEDFEDNNQYDSRDGSDDSDEDEDEEDEEEDNEDTNASWSRNRRANRQKKLKKEDASDEED